MRIEEKIHPKPLIYMAMNASERAPLHRSMLDSRACPRARGAVAVPIRQAQRRSSLAPGLAG